MLFEIYTLPAVLTAIGIGVLGFVVALIVGAAAGEKGKALLRGLEAGLLALAGGLIARSFIGGVLALGGAEAGDGLAVGWFFFLWPGAVDTITSIFGGRPLTGTASLLWIALFVGSLAGFFDGLWRIHRWKGPGVVTFLADVTWGLLGTTNAVLLHLVNFAWGDHTDERRSGAHRYESGFALNSDFAFTQGSVMSSLDEGPGQGLYEHERTHVLQNRLFGPLFSLTYLGWMAFMLLPGLIEKARSRGTVQEFCYYNNPWEAWAFCVGHEHGDPKRTSWGTAIWSDRAVAFASIAYFPLALAVVALIVAFTWF